VALNCKHVAALIFAAEDRGRLSAPAPTADDGRASMTDPSNLPGPWHDVLTRLSGTHAPDAAASRQRLVYLLDRQPTRNGEVVTVQPRSVSVLKSGAWGKTDNPYDPCKVLRGQPAKFLSAGDVEILRVLAGDTDLDAGEDRSYGAYGRMMFAGATSRPIALSAPLAPWLLKRLRETGRLYWQSHKTSPPLAAGDPLALASGWRKDPDGTQRFVLTPTDEAIAADDLAILPLDPLHYVDPAGGVIGVAEADLPAAAAAQLLRAPALKPSQAAALRTGLEQHGVTLPALPAAPTERREARVEPTPVLRLTRSHLLPGAGGRSWKAAYANVGSVVTVGVAEARYASTSVDLDAGQETLELLEGDELVVVRRDRETERAIAVRLANLGLQTVYRAGATTPYTAPPRGYTFLDAEGREDADAWLGFMHSIVSELRAEGWSIEIEADFPYVVRETDHTWTLDIDTQSADEWFGVSLGIEIDGERVDLLPLVSELLGQFPPREAGAADDAAETDAPTYLRIDAQTVLALPTRRARRIAEALRGLFDRPQRDGAIGLPAAEIGELASVEDASGEGDLTVRGGADVRALARTLREGGGLTGVPVPDGLAGSLRPYQHAGLDWLQTLARHGFGGVLADDMGLGKTIQALAHVLSEKEQGRLDRPCLLVAPTSVIWNWRAEAAKFAPGLSTLVLHGPDRKQHFDAIPDTDLVLTTYALLPRDAKTLQTHAYYLLICDEAQAVKNPDALAAKYLRQLDARQVVCLTGTPVENHLDELWSLLRLTMPSLFGDRTAFRKQFRTPIEKHGDTERRAALVRRVRPFLLRRTKEHVAGELPARTETHEHVQLGGAQRDLYETVRVAMDKRVREEISKHGVARSQITLLDALLKLRQVCCDPRLVKLDAAKQVEESAKLDRLLAMLDDLVAEGRQVLVFSQFSSMLGLIGDALAARGHGHVVLTGDTRDRQTPVRRFQAGEVPIFLISLKAGGTGLNLTAADTVIHYDPWWNPAVEAQASDRAHRIGQDKPVFVYKMIAEGTVEERIVAMQGRKRDLAALVHTAEAGEGAAFTESDVESLLAPITA
jgi:superfamily II DNA or RNA helicase